MQGRDQGEEKLQSRAERHSLVHGPFSPMGLGFELPMRKFGRENLRVFRTVHLRPEAENWKCI